MIHIVKCPYCLKEWEKDMPICAAVALFCKSCSDELGERIYLERRIKPKAKRSREGALLENGA